MFEVRERAVEMGIKGRQSAEDFHIDRRAAELGEQLRRAAAQAR